MVKLKGYSFPISFGLGFVFLISFMDVPAQNYENKLFSGEDDGQYQGIESRLIVQRQGQQKRVNLVMDNENYQYAEILQNPINDPRDFVQSLIMTGDVNRFTQSPPRLLDFSTPHNTTRHPNPTYYITLDIPEQSFPALGKVTIEQQPNVENIEFDLSRTEAFFGTRRDRQESIPITVKQGENSNLIEIYFDSPIAANNQVTIALRPYRNPNFAGIFQFTTYAFPVGDDTIGMNLGLGRLHFYRFNF